MSRAMTIEDSDSSSKSCGELLDSNNSSSNSTTSNTSNTSNTSSNSNQLANGLTARDINQPKELGKWSS